MRAGEAISRAFGRNFDTFENLDVNGFLQFVANEHQIRKFGFDIICKRISQYKAIPIWIDIYSDSGVYKNYCYAELTKLMGQNCQISLSGNVFPENNCNNVKINGFARIIPSGIKITKFGYYKIRENGKKASMIEEDILKYNIPIYN